MFETIIQQLHQELDNSLQPNLKKAYGLKEKVADKELRNRLEQKYMEFSGAIERAALCIDILSYNASLEVSEDQKVVKLL